MKNQRNDLEQLIIDINSLDACDRELIGCWVEGLLVKAGIVQVSTTVSLQMLGQLPSEDLKNVREGVDAILRAREQQLERDRIDRSYAIKRGVASGLFVGAVTIGLAAWYIRTVIRNMRGD